MKLPISLVPFHTCRWSLVSILSFADSTVSCRAVRSLSKSFDLSHGGEQQTQGGCMHRRAYKASRVVQVTPRVKGSSSNCFQQALNMGPGLFYFNLFSFSIKDALKERVKCNSDWKGEELLAAVFECTILWTPLSTSVF